MPPPDPHALYPDVGTDKRLRYFDGQFLRATDFGASERYLIDRHRRLAEGITRPGIVSGLTVSSPGVDRVAVAPGSAIDARGRQIVLLAATEARMPARGVTKRLVVRYGQTATDRASGAKGVAGETRFTEAPVLAWIEPGAALGATDILLAVVTANAAGAISFGAIAADAQRDRIMGLTSPGLAEIGGGATIRGDAGGGKALKVSGAAEISGGLTVGGWSVAPFPAHVVVGAIDLLTDPAGTVRTRGRGFRVPHVREREGHTWITVELDRGLAGPPVIQASAMMYHSLPAGDAIPNARHEVGQHPVEITDRLNAGNRMRHLIIRQPRSRALSVTFVAFGLV